MRLKYQICVTGIGKAVKQSANRSYATAKEAKEYIEAFIDGEATNYSKDGMTCGPVKDSNFKHDKAKYWSIYTNFDIRRVLKGLKCRKFGSCPFIEDPKQMLSKLPMPKTSDAKYQKSKKKSITAAREKVASGKSSSLITLSDICKELGLEPKKARQKLRAAVSKGTIEHPGARWEWVSDEATTIKELLQ